MTPEPEPKRKRGERRKTPSSEKLNEERTRLTRIRSLAAAMELARRRGELISRDYARTQAGYLLTAMKQKLTQLPLSMARRLAELNDPDAVAKELRKGIFSALSEIERLPGEIEEGWRKKVEKEMAANAQRGQRRAREKESS